MSLYDKYKNEVVSKLMEDYNYKSIMAVPKIEKVIINVGLGNAIKEKDLIILAEKEITPIVGQKLVRTKAKKSIAGFKLREGMEIGLKATLRKKKMYDFLEKLINIALPRVKDFNGISANSFDGRGNYTLGIKEHVIFPEVDFDKVQKIFGMDITIVTSAKTDEEARSLLKYIGMPFKKN
ncbi:MAG TPA: 50S ribosomal protein L5 [Spirochaetota bacterium]|nr:50S ribosomal protein L5 [Spirochaetota bacterium]HOM37926.1 50S ribosomal protein L5 [Spirochaetota bacterium]HPQ48730.1 50S ribosomal protein L5 [Spirochaetota bacterium]